MRIKRLEIPDFKNLKNLKLQPENDIAQVLIGQNATGKSNLLEALVAIFRHLDLNEPQPFEYLLEYECRGYNILIKAGVKKVRIEITEPDSKDKKNLELEAFSNQALEYLPAQVFAYYSGRNERLEKLFYDHQREQYLKLRGRYVENEEGYLQFRSEDDLLRRLFYCRNEHSWLILLTYLIDFERRKLQSADKDNEDKLLQKYLRISGIESALFVLHKPKESPSESIETSELIAPEEAGDERFWNASGIIAEFLSVLWNNARAPIDDNLNIHTDFRGHTQPQETIYLYLDRDRLIKVSEEIGDINAFFRQLEGVYMADYLDEIRIKVYRDDVDKPLFIKELSEGEQQLMTIFGFLHFSRDNETLFLLDEPDTHLNPIWKYNYFNLMIDDVLAGKEDFLQKNQLFITTHDPLMLGTLTKEQVLVIGGSTEKTTVEHPRENPRGMGYSNLLRSEMFGLRSTIDLKTLEDIDERNRLIAKREKSGLDLFENKNLEELQSHIEELGFGREFEDPMYQLFIQKMYENKKQPLDNILTSEQMKQQEQLADKIVKELIHKEKMDELSDLAKELKIQLDE
jgi:predicted ATPase